MVINFQVLSVHTDPSQYKRFAPILRPDEPLFVALEVPEDEIMDVSSDGVTVTPKGFAQSLLQLYAAIEEIENAHLYIMKNRALADVEFEEWKE